MEENDIFHFLLFLNIYKISIVYGQEEKRVPEQ